MFAPWSSLFSMVFGWDFLLRLLAVNSELFFSLEFTFPVRYKLMREFPAVSYSRRQEAR